MDEGLTQEYFNPALKFNHQQPVIFDGCPPVLSPPFNGVVIHLNGQIFSELKWDAAKELARQSVQKGYLLFWHLELGLFDQLTLPLTDQMQFLSLALAIEHFKKEVLPEFASESLGISILRAEADFSLHFQWKKAQEISLQQWLQDHADEQLLISELSLHSPLNALTPSMLYSCEYGRQLLAFYCQDICVHYLNSLAARLADALPCYLLLDATSLQGNLTKQLQLLNPHCFEHFQLAIKGTDLPLGQWGWHCHATEKGYIGARAKMIEPAAEKALGICLPLMHFRSSSPWEKIVELTKQLKKLNYSFRLISENHLTTEWQGLETIFFVPEALSSQGKRKLLGFCAAGGEVVSLGQIVGLPNEQLFTQWYSSNI